MIREIHELFGLDKTSDDDKHQRRLRCRVVIMPRYNAGPRRERLHPPETRTSRGRHEEVAALLADPVVIGNSNRFRELSQEYARLEPVVQKFTDYLRAERDLESAKI